MTMQEVDEILSNIPAEEHQFVIIKSSGIFIHQDTRCELWRKCIFKESSFESVAEELDNNWERLLSAGFNCNFLTRQRWLDIYVLSQKIKVPLEKIMYDLNISQSQKESWKLTPEETQALEGDGTYSQSRNICIIL